MNIKNKLLVMALEQEAFDFFKQENIIFTGIGKINATYNLTKAIQDYKPEIIINLGSAGSSYFKTGELVNCTGFVQRDMDISPLGFEKYLTPFEENLNNNLSNNIILKYGERIESLPEAICGTGDSFDVSGNSGGLNNIYKLVDMEAYALAKTCMRENIKFICVKFISDGADKQASDQWENSLQEGAKKLFNFYKNFIF